MAYDALFPPDGANVALTPGYIKDKGEELRTERIVDAGFFMGHEFSEFAMKTDVTSGFLKNVKDFGAVGDNVADDTIAIQAALDSGGNIWFPDGIYRITGTLNVTHSNATLVGGNINFK